MQYDSQKLKNQHMKRFEEFQNRNLREIQMLYFDPNTGNAVLLLYGPPHSPYEGYCFRIDFQPSPNYPYSPPKVKFLDKIWNPYVQFDNGKICCDLLQSKWSPTIAFYSSIALSILSLMAENKIQDAGVNLQASFDMQKKYSKFFNQAKEKAEQHCYKKQKIFMDQQKPMFEQIQDKKLSNPYETEMNSYIGKNLFSQSNPNKQENRKNFRLKIQRHSNQVKFLKCYNLQSIPQYKATSKRKQVKIQNDL